MPAARVPVVDALRTAGSRRARQLLLDPLLRRCASPTVQRLLHVGGAAHTEAAGVLRALLDDGDDPDLLPSVRRDFARRHAELCDRIRRDEDRRILPDHYDMGARSAELLYGLVRLLRPEVVVETGVANGVSTFFLTSALLDNGAGSLCSIDVRGDVAPILPAPHRDIWRLVVLPSRGRRRLLERALDEAGPIDVFVHDSHHSHGWQLAEYERALPRLRPGGVLASDDVDASFAFATFCERHGLRAEYLFDDRKFFGVTRR